MKNNEFHWDSGLMSINPTKIRKYSGKIVRSMLDESHESHLLNLTVRRDADGLEREINFCYCEFIEGEMMPDEVAAYRKEHNVDLQAKIKAVYRDFEVREASELVGKTVNAHYFGNALVAIQKP